MQRIVIFAPGKSGTTALFYKIKSALKGQKVFEQFEPRHFELPHAEDDHDYCLIKALLSPDRFLDYSAYRTFENKIYIVRDPRDWLISTLLYRMRNPNLVQGNAALSQIVSLLEQKERDPLSISVYRLLEEFARISDQKIDNLVGQFRNLHI